MRAARAIRCFVSLPFALASALPTYHRPGRTPAQYSIGRSAIREERDETRPDVLKASLRRSTAKCVMTLFFRPLLCGAFLSRRAVSNRLREDVMVALR